jgi:hypothetical protein
VRAQWQAPSSEGTYTISVFVSDNGGFFCGGRLDVTPTLDIQVATQTSEPPVIDSLTATPLQLLSGQTSDLLCSATDPDGDPVSYSWDTDSGTVTPGVGGAAVFTAGDPGVATVTCTATDPGGAFGLDTIALSVTGAVADSMITSGLITPRRLSADPWGNVYVVDRSVGGIAVVNLFTEQLVYTINLPDVTSVAVDWNNDLLVGGTNGAQIVDRDGQPVSVVTLGGGLGEVSDVAVDPVGRKYGVLHRKAGRVGVYDEFGAPLAAFG